MIFEYHLAVPHLPYSGIEAGAGVPPIALNMFNSFLKRGGRPGKARGAHMPGRVRTEVGPGTEAKAKVLLIAQL